jgi:hypothetical protein
MMNQKPSNFAGAASRRLAGANTQSQGAVMKETSGGTKPLAQMPAKSQSRRPLHSTQFKAKGSPTLAAIRTKLMGSQGK